MAPTYATVRADRGVAAVAVAIPATRYGEGRRLNSPAVILTVLLHVALIAALFMVRNHFVHKREAKLTVLNLMPESPPPQATPEQPQPQQPVIVAPRPIVQTPAPPVVVMQTTPEPPPPQPVALPAATAAVTGPPAPPMAISVIDRGDLGGDLLAAKPPRYPMDSRLKKEQGTVVLAVTVGIDGGVAAISVRKSSGFARLDNAALDAVRKWRWKPIRENGQPVIVKGEVPIPFVLQG
ncbi:MAG TPA: energy transducer TonB [Sphingobium sp.]|uniref:energy transducer TonB n=1 Tax=Sphingobium sp. TaxID=1912891 RepID=UPI002ED2E74C